MAYATLAELKAEINLSATTHDINLTRLLDAVTDAIDKFCNRPDGFEAVAVATARAYKGSGTTVQWIDECISVTTVAVKDSPSDTTYDAWVPADWIAASGDPDQPDYNRTPYTFLIVSAVGDYNTFTSGQYSGRRGFRPHPMRRGVPTVQVTARWGYAATVPAVIKEAAIAQAARWYKRGLSSWQDATTQQEFGQLTFQRLDRDIRFMLVDTRLIRPAIGRRF